MLSRYPLIGGTVLLCLSGCSGNPASPVPLPTGEQTMTGTLLPTEIATLRRGTHVLMANGQRLCYVESSTVNLRVFENRVVAVHGVFEPNTDATFLPVLVADQVTPAEEETQDVSFPPADLHGTVPRAWLQANRGGSTVFLLPGGSEPILSVSRRKDTPLPSTGAPFQISGHHAVRHPNKTNSGETLSIQDGTDLLEVTFTPSGYSDEVAFLRTQWTAFLSSLRFGKTASSSASASTSSGSLTGTPCGGTAGILCPSGQYCAITDLKENIGHCRKL